MSKATKFWLITAVCLIVLGCILFVSALAMADWDITKLETAKHETNHHRITEAFREIVITTDTADVVFQPSKDGSVSVVCYEQISANHAVTVKNGVLEIRLVDERKWYEHISILHIKSHKITVSLPAGQYGALTAQTDTGKVDIPESFSFEAMDIAVSTGSVRCAASATEKMKIKTDTGSIHLQSISVGTLELSTSTGKVTAEEIDCAGEAKLTVNTGDIHLTDFKSKTIDAKADTGDLLFTKVMVEEVFLAETDTGRVEFDGCDAGELRIKTDTGGVTGSLLSPKIFYAETDTGKVNVPKTTTGGKCEITTDTGNIHITIAE